MRAASLLAVLLLLGSGWALALPDHGPDLEPLIVQFTRAPTPAEMGQMVARGFAHAVFLDLFPGMVCHAPPAARAWLEAQPWVQRVDGDEPLQRHLDLSTRLLRAGAAVADDLGVDGSGVTIAVLDSGIDTTHPDFQGRVLANVLYADGTWVDSPADLDGHGTHVAGVAAGSGAASGGALRGVAPGASLVGMDFSKAFTTSTALLAFDWVLRNARALDIRVVTNSWGRADNTEGWDPGDALVRASNRLVTEGLVVVFSSGNHGPGPGTLSLEAENPNVISVGAVDDAGVEAGFSGRGPVVDAQGRRQDWVKPDVVAPGVTVRSARSAQAAGPMAQPSLQPSQLPLPILGPGAGAQPVRYVDLSGTSQAAPHVAGIVALMLEANPRLTPGQVHNLLREAAIDLGAEGPDDATGFGLVDARDAVQRARGAPPDQGNILLAGGEETYVARGTLAGSSGQLVQTSPVLQVEPKGAVEATFPVKVGATSARFDFAWTPATTAFRVYLVGPDETLGPWTAMRAAGAERVVSGLVDRPTPGMYHLLARPVSAGAQVDYRATATVAIREQARLPAELGDRYRAPEQVGPLDQVASELQYEFDKIAHEWRRTVPGPEAAAALAVLAGAALALPRSGGRRGRGGPGRDRR